LRLVDDKFALAGNEPEPENGRCRITVPAGDNMMSVDTESMLGLIWEVQTGPMTPAGSIAAATARAEAAEPWLHPMPAGTRRPRISSTHSSGRHNHPLDWL